MPKAEQLNLPFVTLDQPRTDVVMGRLAGTAPQPPNQPPGWIAQPLTDAPLRPLRGPACCVAAFDDPALW